MPYHKKNTLSSFSVLKTVWMILAIGLLLVAAKTGDDNNASANTNANTDSADIVSASSRTATAGSATSNDSDKDTPVPSNNQGASTRPPASDKKKSQGESQSKAHSTASPTTTEPPPPPTPAPLHPQFKKLDWLVGKWRGEFSGKVFWPTIPTMNYGEELIIEEAPVAKSSGVRFLNFSARAWSHTTKDQLHDEWGFMTINDLGNVTLMTAGNNGFTTYEEGWVDGQQLILRLKKIGRISFSRDLPVEDLERRFKRLDKTYLEQALRMRTATHPKVGLLDHTIIIYEKKG